MPTPSLGLNKRDVMPVRKSLAHHGGGASAWVSTDDHEGTDVHSNKTHAGMKAMPHPEEQRLKGGELEFTWERMGRPGAPRAAAGSTAANTTRQREMGRPGSISGHRGHKQWSREREPALPLLEGA